LECTSKGKRKIWSHQGMVQIWKAFQTVFSKSSSMAIIFISETLQPFDLNFDMLDDFIRINIFLEIDSWCCQHAQIRLKPSMILVRLGLSLFWWGKARDQPLDSRFESQANCFLDTETVPEASTHLSHFLDPKDSFSPGRNFDFPPKSKDFSTKQSKSEPLINNGLKHQRNLIDSQKLCCPCPMGRLSWHQHKQH
jgi:hypothetical protein